MLFGARLTSEMMTSAMFNAMNRKNAAAIDPPVARPPRAFIAKPFAQVIGTEFCGYMV